LDRTRTRERPVRLAALARRCAYPDEGGRHRRCAPEPRQGARAEPEVTALRGLSPRRISCSRFPKFGNFADEQNLHVPRTAAIRTPIVSAAAGVVKGGLVLHPQKARK